MKYTALLIFSFLFQTAFAQKHIVSGTVKDAGGIPVPFVSVYVKNTTLGTSANIDGLYRLSLDTGAVTLVYQAIGYKATERKFRLTANRTENIVLTAEAYTLKGVTITNDGKDPAEGIMRKAIKKRKTYLNEVKEFSTSVYTKGMQKLVGAPKKFLGTDIQKTLDLDTNRKGVIYLSESESVFDFKRPGHIHEVMISSKIAGRNNTFTFNKASDLMVNFYDNIMMQNVVNTTGFVSPLADNAFAYYTYKLIGVTNENGVLTNKIKVIPRRKNDPAFAGTIYIAEDSWRLTGADVYLVKNAGISFLDTMSVVQQFSKVQKSYMPATINFSFKGNVLGFKFEGYYLGVYTKYNLNPAFPANYFKGEILKVPDSVNKKDALYWANNRPIPLTGEELHSYKRKDSIADLRESKPYLDSVDRVNNKLSPGKLLYSGYVFNNRSQKRMVRFDPILKGLFYNTVEGFGLRYGATYFKDLENRKNFSIRPELRYGFSNQMLTGTVRTNYFYDPLKRASVNFAFGNGVYDLNNYGTMSTLTNSLNSLLFERNFSKFYKKNFINAGTSRELATGLQAAVLVEYTKNQTLTNHTDFTIFDRENRSFTANNPFTPNQESALFPDYKALTINAALTYTFDQTYITRPDGKFYMPSKYPTLKLSYKKGIHDVLGSDVDYDLIRFEISKEKISAGLFGYSQFFVGVGKFLNNKSVYYPELQHFKGGNSLTSQPDIRRFSFLDFYTYSTDKQYLEAHFEHNFAGLFTNKIPVFRKLKLEELVGVNYLTQPLKKNYSELYFGFQRLIFRATYGFAFDGNKKVEHGFRLYYGF